MTPNPTPILELRTVSGDVLLRPIRKALRPAERMRGWMGRSHPPEVGLWIEPCRAIHTWFVRFPLDAYWISREGIIVRIHRNIQPWRMATGGRNAHAVLETRAGEIPETPLQVGDRVQLTNLPFSARNIQQLRGLEIGPHTPPDA